MIADTLEVPIVGGTLLMAMHWTLRAVHVQNHSLVWSMGHSIFHPLGIHSCQPLQVVLLGQSFSFKAAHGVGAGGVPV